MYFSKDADSVPTFESPWIHQGWTPAVIESAMPSNHQIFSIVIVIQSTSRVQLFKPHGLQHVRLSCPSPSPGVCPSCHHWISDAIQPSHPLSSPSPPAGVQPRWIQGDSKVGMESASLEKYIFNYRDIERLETDGIVGKLVEKRRLNHLVYVE